MGVDGLVIFVSDAAALAAPILAGLFDFLRWRRKSKPQPPAQPAFPPMTFRDGADQAEGAPAPGAPGQHVAPKIVKAYGPPPPEPRALDAETHELLPGAQPRVAKVASEEEEEEGEIEDTAREAIASCKLMLASLEEGGMNIAVAVRQLTRAESALEQGNFEEAVNYATKAMDLAEDMEADQDRCPQCHAETKPKWQICPKCGQPLRK